MFSVTLCYLYIFFVTVFFTTQISGFPRKPIEELSSLEYMYADPKDIAAYGTRLLPEKTESMLDKAADALDDAIKPIETVGENGISFFQNISNLFYELWHILLATGVSVLLVVIMCACIYQAKKRSSKRAAINAAVTKRLEILSNQKSSNVDQSTTVV